VNTVAIQLTVAQVDTAEWVLGLPLFDLDADSLAYEWDETPKRAAAIVAAAALVKLDGRTLTIPVDRDVVEYLVADLERLADMSGDEYVDELLGKGRTHKVAQCIANAKVRSVESLSAKVGGVL
jgi:MoxR-like ATPase